MGIKRLTVGWLNGLSEKSAARADDAQVTPTQILISPSTLVYEDDNARFFFSLEGTRRMSASE